MRGPRRAAVCLNLVARDTIDEAIVEALIAKRDVAAEIIDRRKAA